MRGIAITFADLRIIRQFKKITAERISKILEMSTDEFLEYEEGRKKPDPLLVRKWVRLLGLKPLHVVQIQYRMAVMDRQSVNYLIRRYRNRAAALVKESKEKIALLKLQKLKIASRRNTLLAENEKLRELVRMKDAKIAALEHELSVRGVR